METLAAAGGGTGSALENVNLAPRARNSGHIVDYYFSDIRLSC